MDNKKICVISAYAYIVDHINYGSLLQYYALEKILDQLGYESYWLRFVLQTEHNRVNIKYVIKNILCKQRNDDIANTLGEFQYFITKYLRVSEKEYTEQDLLREPPIADAYITGSDQVWGGTLQPNYLCFADNKHIKISYAASFGKSHITEEHKTKITPWVKRLDYVSVREPSGIQICKEIGKNATLVLDPTLLLKKEYYPIDTTTATSFGNYYFAYFLNVTKRNARDYIDVINKAESDLGRVVVSAGVSEIDRFISKRKSVFCSPEKWLGMYSSSEGIITNTFHGTVFAIIFRKPFLVCFQKGTTAEQNERIISLLDLFGLKNRVFYDGDCIKNQMHRPIDWKLVDDVIQKKGDASVEFLDRSLKGAIK